MDLHFDLGFDFIVGRDGFVIDVKVEGFAFKDTDGRNSYRKGSVFQCDVEFGSCTLELLTSSIANELKVPPNQLPTVWFFDKRMHENVKLVSEIQMLDVFEMYKEEMGCQLVVGLFDKSLCVDAECDGLLPLCAIPNEPSSAAPVNPEAAIAIGAEGEPGTDATNNVEPERVPDIFDNPEEYVGFNDERIYIEIPDPIAQPTNIAQTTNDVNEDKCWEEDQEGLKW
jgi:hypothetical protein